MDYQKITIPYHKCRHYPGRGYGFLVIHMVSRLSVWPGPYTHLTTGSAFT